MRELLLGINVDHVATIREARRTPYPAPVTAAMVAESSGADSITVHLREDRRHIQERDVLVLKERLRTRLNLEMAVTEGMIAFAASVRPDDSCLVPERREELTTEGGLDVAADVGRIGEAVTALADAGSRVALFVDPDLRQLDAAREAGVRVVELHTGAYADAVDEVDRLRELQRLTEAAVHADSIGLEVHAGHGLTFENVAAVAVIPEIVELNIGHAVVADALFVGFAAAVSRMKRAIQAARSA
jgi:pyridoxine 5-phosphate synthase